MYNSAFLFGQSGATAHGGLRNHKQLRVRRASFKASIATRQRRDPAAFWKTAPEKETETKIFAPPCPPAHSTLRRHDSLEEITIDGTAGPQPTLDPAPDASFDSFTVQEKAISDHPQRNTSNKK